MAEVLQHLGFYVVRGGAETVMVLPALLSIALPGACVVSTASEQTDDGLGGWFCRRIWPTCGSAVAAAAVLSPASSRGTWFT